MSRPHVVLASQEVWPFVGGGGLGRYVRDAANLLARDMDVTVLLPERFRAHHRQLADSGELPFDPHVQFAWAPDVVGGDLSPFASRAHAVADSLWQALRSIHERRPVDLIELADYGGDAAVVVDAVRAGSAGDPAPRVCVRLHTTWELTAVLNGVAHHDDVGRYTMALERHALRFADALLTPSAKTFETYERFYGRDGLAASRIVPMPLASSEVDAVPSDPPPAGNGLRLLFVGRLEERKGVRALVAALREVDDPRLRLTVVGRDTPTAPGGGSMRAELDRLSDGDPRIAIRDEVPHDALSSVYAAHHLVVLPSRFESYGYVAREALQQNRPLLVTPVGGLEDAVAQGSGWVAEGTDHHALAAAIEALAADPGAVDRMIASRAPQSAALPDPGAFTAAYRRLLDEVAAVAVAEPKAADELTAVVVANDSTPLTPTLDAIAAIPGTPVETIVVADDPRRVALDALDRIDALQLLPAATDDDGAFRTGIAARRRDGAVLLLRAGDRFEPSFVPRGLGLLARDGGPAYVTARGTGRAPSAVPIANDATELLPERDLGGTVLLVAPDAVDTLTAQARGAAFSALASGRRFGLAIPETLLGRPRTRPGANRPAGDALAEIERDRMQWI
ncbi:glycosyltransferase family 4 protein [Patulibacter defluvii]|uniref:glycosyltransferase family 4 protein n=1 Tax=Patulibacter defluvii TaxID=3095358 RepID=UPI002A747B23|nr:glycosyltransferase family 4 protein [Patulibacter sp. DM4]